MKRFLPILFALPLLFTACDQGKHQDKYFTPGAEGCVRIYAWGEDGGLTLSASFTEVEESITTVGPMRNWEGGFHKLIFGVTELPSGFSHSPLYASQIENLAIVMDVRGGTSPYRDLLCECESPKLPGQESQALIDEIMQTYDNNVNHIYTSSLYWFVHAGFGDIRIKADKTLFGIEPGGDLSSHFKMIYSPELFVKFPTYEIVKGCGESNPEELSNWQGALLSYMWDYVIKVKDSPTERYDYMTFTIEVDVLLPDNKMQTISNSVTVQFEE